jgi:hypothetical protein
LKRRDGTIPALPSKRLYLAIISEYNLNKAICELVDNVLDIWQDSDRSHAISVEIDIDTVQQTIRIKDDAGGIARGDLHLIVAPGETENTGTDQTIGLFGVGSKRAVVALAMDVKIRTRKTGTDATYLVEFDENWIENSDDWDLPRYEVDAIDPGTTIIDLSRLRIQPSEESVKELRTHLGVTYASFLRGGNFAIKLDGTKVEPVTFHDWAFIPKYKPIDYTATLPTEYGDVNVRLRAGLMRRSSQVGEYGVYFYCNRRFVVGAVHDDSVGFVTGLLGQPHASRSLLRAELWLEGPARSMPWNSTKSGIHQDHKVFVALRSWLAQTLKDWSSLSRRLVSDWPTKVTPYATGSVRTKRLGVLPAAGRSYLPTLPRSNRGVGDRLRDANREIGRQKHWVVGLYESMAAVEIVLRQNFEQKNRIALIVLDATLEIGLKEYLVHLDGPNRLSDRQLRDLDRISLQARVKALQPLTSDVWTRADHYYDLRSKLVHERATVAPSDTEIEDYREVVETILGALFDLQFVD